MLSIPMLLAAVLITILLSRVCSSDTDKLQPHVIVKANSNLPSCMNVSDENYSENVPQFTNTSRGISGIFRNFSTEGPDRLCFPLSPQLTHCKIATLSFGMYTIENKTLVYGVDKNLTAMLGDYYIAPNGTAMVCDQWINATKGKRSPRCHYINLQLEEYEINENGSFYLKTARALVEQPTYMVNIQEKSANICFPLSIEFLNCQFKGIIPPSEYKILQDLKLQLRNRVNTPDLSEYYLHTSGRNVVACIPISKNHETSRYIAKVYAVFFFLSSLFLLLTSVIKIKSSKNNCHDKSLICHISCLLINTVLASVRRFITIPESTCHIFFAIVYLSAMSAYFWLNTIAFDTWHSFASLTGMLTRRRQLSEQCKFLCYFIYASGIPIILLVLVLVLDKNRSLQDTLVIYPEIILQCWMNDTPSEIAFYDGPLIVIMGINVVFFVLTMIHIHKAGRGTDLVNRRRKKQLLIICIKLFVVMGIAWMTDGILFILQGYLPLNYWYISDAVSALQGFAIFFVLIVCNKESRRGINCHISISDIFRCKKCHFCKLTKSSDKAPDVKRKISNITITTQLSVDVRQ